MEKKREENRHYICLAPIYMYTNTTKNKKKNENDGFLKFFFNNTAIFAPLLFHILLAIPPVPLISSRRDLSLALKADHSPVGFASVDVPSVRGSNSTWALCGGISGSLSRAKSVWTLANWSLSWLYEWRSRPDFRAFLCTVIKYWRSRTSGIRYSCKKPEVYYWVGYAYNRGQVIIIVVHTDTTDKCTIRYVLSFKKYVIEDRFFDKRSLYLFWF